MPLFKVCELTLVGNEALHSYSLTVLILPQQGGGRESEGKKNKKLSKFRKGQVSKKIEKGNKEKK